MKMLNLKENKGITLIALVITIIVLTILTGVSITAVTGEKTIIKEANDAKNVTNEELVREKVELAIFKATNKDGEIDIDILNNKLGTSITTLPAIIQKDGLKVLISIGGKVEILNY